MSETATQPNHRLLMLTVNFDTFDGTKMPHYSFLHCLRGVQIWQVARSERADIVVVRCDIPSDFDIVRDLRLVSPKLPVVVVGTADKRDEALKMRCAFVEIDADVAVINKAASDAFNMVS